MDLSQYSTEELKAMLGTANPAVKPVDPSAPITDLNGVLADAALRQENPQGYSALATGTANDLSKMTTEQLQAELAKLSPVSEAPKQSMIGREISDIPRQLGLTGRYVAEGLSQLGDLPNMAINAVGEPFGMKPLMYPSQVTSSALSRMGVPEPRNGVERVVGDVSRALVGTGAGAGIAGALGKSAPALSALAENTGVQAKAAAASSGASSITKEAGGSELAQLGAGLLGGVAATRSSIPKKQVYTAEDVKNLSNEAYKKADELGGAIKPEAAAKFVANIEKTLPQDRAALAFEGNSPARSAIKTLQGLTEKPITLTEAQSIDKSLANMANQYLNPNGTLKNEGREILEIQTQFRKMIQDASPDMLIGGKGGFEAWRDGSKLWSKAMKLNDVERIISRADVAENPATAIRSGFKTLYNNKKALRGYSEEEVSAIKSAAKSGIVDEALRMAGSRLLPIIGAGTGNLSSIASVPMGAAAREGGALLQLRRAANVAEKVAGSKPRDITPTLKAGEIGTFYGTNKQENK
jgi:hypothetical protein